MENNVKSLNRMCYTFGRGSKQGCVVSSMEHEERFLRKRIELKWLRKNLFC